MISTIKTFLKATALAAVCLAVHCCTGSPSTSVYGSEGPLVIYPDYKDVTIPVNIAPLNYYYAISGAKNAKTTFSLDGKSVTIRGLKVEWNLRKWKSFIAGSEGKAISVSARVRLGGDEILEDSWQIHVSGDKVDPYLTYRLIEPAYQMWSEVSIMERNVENFDETSICDHQNTENSCMNCHIHGKQDSNFSMFYIRGAKGGAILNNDGNLRKLTLKTDGMISGTVYGDLHPSGRFGVFSTNIIIPGLHSKAASRTEVYDTASDLAVADFENNTMVIVPHAARADRFETFPCFSADGESVFYCVADTLPVPQKLDSLLYSLVRVPFDTNTGRMGEKADTVWNAREHNASVCHPRTSPDGRWILFSVADYGTFPINHAESGLHLIDLQSGEIHTLDSIKGNNSDTFSSWSSDSRWFVFASKRGDGQYSKAYYCHIDDEGNPSKPFVLPQKSARFYEFNLRSFNVPDIGRYSTGMTARRDARKIYNADSEPFSEVNL